jgi:hypothetical protein
MSVTFCSECGKKHEYNFAKPNFCSSCGAGFGVQVKSKASTNRRTTQRGEEDLYDGDDEDFSDCDGVPNIDKIQIDVEHVDSANVFSLGSIFGNPQEANTRTRKRPMSLENFKNNKK